MRNRWYHPPILHSPEVGKERKAGWLELFYDLIYVAAFIQLGNGLSANVGGLGVLAFAGVFVPLFLAWTSYTFFTNRFLIDDFLHRALTFLQMFGVGAMAVSAADVLAGETSTFALSYAFTRFVFVLFYVRAWLQVPNARELTLRWGIVSLADCILWTLSAFAPWPWLYLLWIVGVLAQLSIPLLPQSRALSLRYPPDVLHMTERYGLLTLIVLGESFVKVLGQLYDTGLVMPAAPMGGLALLITFSLWWLYFDDVAGSRLKHRRSSAFIWIYAHLPLTLALTGTGVAIKKTLDFMPWEPAAEKYRWLLAGMLALASISVGIIDAVTERRQSQLNDRSRVNLRFFAAGVVLLVGAIGGYLPAWVFVTILAVVCLAQVIFDLMLAPIESDTHDAMHDAQLAVGTYTQPMQPQTTAKSDRNRDPIVKSAPNELRRDIFFFLMESSLPRFFGLLTIIYVALNCVFAALYLLEPGSVANIREGSLADAFFFSVQTMATIGYGVMAPHSTYAHTLVVIESVFGLLGVALITGLTFAKALRPKASVLFSDNMLIGNHYGKRTLMFRAGNARGNEVVDATVQVSILKNDLSPEGQKLRKLYDLKLRRDRSPIFNLSWLVLHEIDAESPLADIDWTQVDRNLISIVVTLNGYDSTYAQTIYARKIYYPDAIRIGYRFIDVIETTADGRMLVDYKHFHDIEKVD